jgi:hypothetical protein
LAVDLGAHDRQQANQDQQKQADRESHCLGAAGRLFRATVARTREQWPEDAWEDGVHEFARQTVLPLPQGEEANDAAVVPSRHSVLRMPR